MLTKSVKIKIARCILANLFMLFLSVCEGLLDLHFLNEKFMFFTFILLNIFIIPLYWIGFWIWGDGYIYKIFKRYSFLNKKYDLNQVGSNESFFVRHWEGNSPLVISYWVNGAFVGSVLFILEMFLNPNHIFYTIFMSIFYTISVWQIVGIWRSATKYIEINIGKAKSAWGYCAKFMMVYSILKGLTG